MATESAGICVTFHRHPSQRSGQILSKRILQFTVRLSCPTEFFTVDERQSSRSSTLGPRRRSFPTNFPFSRRREWVGNHPIYDHAHLTFKALQNPLRRRHMTCTARIFNKYNNIEIKGFSLNIIMAFHVELLKAIKRYEGVHLFVQTAGNYK